MEGDRRNWDELQRLFCLAEQTPPEDRERLLAEACDDPELRQRALTILAAAERESPPLVGLPAGSFIGPYRLLRQIGAGGIGTVYLAERIVDGMSLRSALKILAPHAVDPAFVDRFRREQRNLAVLDHPNITRLLDAGWSETGQPYLTMEYVEGTNLDTYCDAGELGLAARLRLFLQICSAVSHAHRNLIVHLDLKPSNVLVSTAGVVKLLDFGTSKLVQPDGSFTATIVATPAYASPEQLLNEPVTTVSDVYGLGAILYTLLAGRAPFGQTSSIAMIERAAREKEPEPLEAAVTSAAAAARGLGEHSLRQALHGDLATITATCLRRWPRDRYSSVEALAEDIQRHLDNLPVLARPQTSVYRVGRFLRRHRLLASAASVAAIVLCGSLAFAWTRQQQALREAERAVQMQTFLYRLFKMANPDYTGKPVATVAEFLRLGMQKLPDYIHQGSDLRQAQLGLAESMYESGDLADARSAFGQIVANARAAGAAADEAEAEAFAADIDYAQGRTDAARIGAAHAVALSGARGVPPRVRIFSEVFYAFNQDNYGLRSDANLSMLQAAVRECREAHLPERETAFALHYLASDLDLRGRIDEARVIFEQLRGVYERDPLAICDRSEVDGWLAWIHDAQGDIEGSLPLYKRAYEGYAACSGPESQGANSELPYWADALIKSGQAEQAVAMLEKALPLWRRQWGNNPDMSGILLFLARGYVATGRFAEADEKSSELVALMTGRIAPGDRAFGVAHLVWAQALAGQRRYRDAQPHARIAEQLLANSGVSLRGKQLATEAQAVAREVATGLRSPASNPD